MRGERGNTAGSAEPLRMYIKTELFFCILLSPKILPIYALQIHYVK